MNPPEQQQQQQQQRVNQSRRNTRREKYPGRNLYEILEIDPSASREQIKRQYMQLAKVSHPDARNNRRMDLDFSEIAAAYEILSNNVERKKYDRSLKAHEISDQISSWASARATPAAKGLSKALEDVAFPLLRRTTATTLAAATAAAQSSNWQGAVQAAQRATAAVTQDELSTKAAELEQRAVQEYQERTHILQQAEEQAAQRRQWAVATPHAELSARDCELLLQQAQSSVQEPNLHRELATLTEDERLCQAAVRADEQAVEAYDTAMREQASTQQRYTAACKKQERLRQALQEATLELELEESRLADWNDEVRQTQATVGQTRYDVERIRVTVADQIERVRQQVLRQIGGESLPSVDAQELARLVQHERDLQRQAEEKEMKATRLLSRANKLKRRVQDMERDMRR